MVSKSWLERQLPNMMTKRSRVPAPLDSGEETRWDPAVIVGMELALPPAWTSNPDNLRTERARLVDAMENMLRSPHADGSMILDCDKNSWSFKVRAKASKRRRVRDMSVFGCGMR